LRKAAEKAGITGNELVSFLSQCAHETLDFKHMKEIGGSLDFRKYDPKYAPKKAKALGNKQIGDGAKYKGRGYIQLTGRDNYKRAGAALGLPLEAKPELVEKPEVAAKVAVWYWKTRVANKVDSFKDTKAVTKTINPGMKHLDKRQEKQQAFQVAMR
jgi:predicted chitinase